MSKESFSSTVDEFSVRSWSWVASSPRPSCSGAFSVAKSRDSIVGVYASREGPRPGGQLGRVRPLGTGAEKFQTRVRVVGLVDVIIIILELMANKSRRRMVIIQMSIMDPCRQAS